MESSRGGGQQRRETASSNSRGHQRSSGERSSRGSRSTSDNRDAVERSSRGSRTTTSGTSSGSGSNRHHAHHHHHRGSHDIISSAAAAASGAGDFSASLLLSAGGGGGAGAGGAPAAAAARRGSHNRPWQAEDEYIQLTRKQQQSSSPSTSSNSRQRQLYQQQQRDFERFSHSERFSPSDPRLLSQQDDHDRLMSIMSSSDPNLNFNNNDNNNSSSEQYLEEYNREKLREDARQRRRRQESEGSPGGRQGVPPSNSRRKSHTIGETPRGGTSTAKEASSERKTRSLVERPVSSREVGASSGTSRRRHSERIPSSGGYNPSSYRSPSQKQPQPPPTISEEIQQMLKKSKTYGGTRGGDDDIADSPLSPSRRRHRERGERRERERVESASHRPSRTSTKDSTSSRNRPPRSSSLGHRTSGSRRDRGGDTDPISPTGSSTAASATRELRAQRLRKERSKASVSEPNRLEESQAKREQMLNRAKQVQDQMASSSIKSHMQQQQSSSSSQKSKKQQPQSIEESLKAAAAAARATAAQQATGTGTAATSKSPKQQQQQQSQPSPRGSGNKAGGSTAGTPRAVVSSLKTKADADNFTTMQSHFSAAAAVAKAEYAKTQQSQTHLSSSTGTSTSSATAAVASSTNKAPPTAKSPKTAAKAKASTPSSATSSVQQSKPTTTAAAAAAASSLSRARTEPVKAAVAPSSSSSSAQQLPARPEPQQQRSSSLGWSTLGSRSRNTTAQSPSTAPLPPTGGDTMSMSKVNQYLQQRSGGSIGSGTIGGTGPAGPSTTSTTGSSSLFSNMRKSNSNPSLTDAALSASGVTATTVSSALGASMDNNKSLLGSTGSGTGLMSSSYDISSGTDDSSTSSEEDMDDESCSSDEDGTAADGNDWSVRVCVVSAVDFPSNVVPNLPLSPVLRLGLVKIPGNDTSSSSSNNNNKNSTAVDAHRKQLMNAMSQGGIQSVPKSRVRCTSPKVLSKRDNGSLEFHEEIRWDRVKQPSQVALAVELSSRAVMTPKNIKESPPSQKAEPPRVTTASGQLQQLRAGSLRLQSSNKSSPLNNSETASDASSGAGGIGSLFARRTSGKKPVGTGGKAEMETAQAAAVVAKLLVDGNVPNTDSTEDATGASRLNKTGNQSEVNVKLRPRKRRKYAKMTDDLHIGSQIIPLSKLPTLRKALDRKESVARIEQWFELEPSDGPSNPVSGISSLPSASASSSQQGSAGKKRNPSVLLEITFSTVEALDDSEDEMDEDDEVDTSLKASFSRRASHKIRCQLKEEGVGMGVSKDVKAAQQDPELQPGVIDFVCVVGARDIGDQKLDDGASGWVNSLPDLCILEQFPPDDDFHHQMGRNVCLPNKVEWWCFPEGCRLWRGTTPPNLDELNLTRFSASSPANIATSIASFDASLGCTTSFSWFVISSNSDEYGSENVKTFAAVIRFFVPAPTGIDRTQDDFAQAFLGDPNASTDHDPFDVPEGKRLWVPIGICLTSSIPIVGTMESMLLRMCEDLSVNGFFGSPSNSGSQGLTGFASISNFLHQELVSLIVSFQRPVPGVVHCSVPFLRGDRYHLALPPRGGLPALPHGNAVSSVCRLLGADGINFMLAAMLTECKILLHSSDIANLSLVAEVMTALIYPFSWSLPYIPVLPAEMMEFIEAPLSYLLGVPTCTMVYDPLVLDDVVVVDLDKDFSTADYSVDTKNQGDSGMRKKTPTPLPATVASNISKAVYRLLRAEEEAEDEACAVPGHSRSSPRLDPESQIEREFRVAVSMEICGLLRGYQDCLVYASSSQPVFNTDRFLQIAPALFEEQRGTSTLSSSSSSGHQEEFVSQYVLSPRSRRFMSLLVNCQHFHQFLETLESDRYAFFHETMTTISTTNNVSTMRRPTKRSGHVLSLDFHKNLESLCSFLQKMEDSIPNYRVQRLLGDDDNKDSGHGDASGEVELGRRFPRDLLQQIVISGDSNDNESKDTSNDSQQDEQQSEQGVRHISLEYLMELEKNPFRYQHLFDIPLQDADGNPIISLETAKVKLRDAIGERRYRAWKLALEQEKFELDDMSVMSDDAKNNKNQNDGSTQLDLNSLFTSSTADLSSVSSFDNEDSNQNNDGTQRQRVADAKDRDILRRCLEKALATVGGNGKGESLNPAPKGRDLVAEAEVSLRNPMARKFLLSVLSKLSTTTTAQQQQASASPDKNKNSRRSIATSHGASKLENESFDTLLRLACAALDACMEAPEDFDSAYGMLKLTAGIYTITGDTDNDVAVAYMTGRLGLHPIYANLGVWERVKDLHLSARHEDKKEVKANSESDNTEVVEDEEDDEYEAAVATLYEMLGYGIPAEELARFASRVSEKKGWFQSERGQALMLLARRLAVRKEQQGGSNAPAGGKKSDIELMNPGSSQTSNSISEGGGENKDSQQRKGTVQANQIDDGEYVWIESNWCHPAAQSTRRHSVSEKSSMRRPGTQNLLNMLDEQKLLPDAGRQNPKHMKRAAITSMAYLGSSVVVTGGLDGGVFMARRLAGESDPCAPVQGGYLDSHGIRGVHLDWGSSGSRYTTGSSSSSTNNSLDGEYGVGAVACLAATTGNYNHPTYSSIMTSAAGTGGKDVAEPLTEEDLLEAMEGCKVVAGTTCGDLRVWTIKDVYSAVFYSNGGSGDSGSAMSSPNTSAKPHQHPGAEGATSKTVSGKRTAKRPGTDFAAGSSLTRLKFSLRGRALSGHRGGVSCIDVPSSVYRPDSIISGGADGLIKLWSLRSPGAGGHRRGSLEQHPHSPSIHSPGGNEVLSPRSPMRAGTFQSGDALSILSGHGGRILCVKTAWHGDRLLSGGADRTVRLWDLAGGGGKCLHCLSGHFGWVTKVQYWGPNTIISASTDRSIALWDARVRSSPLFSLRHHYSPISDILVGSRTDPMMMSAASDGTVAAWDFRTLSGSEKQQQQADRKNTMKSTTQCQVVRNPPGRLYLHDYSKLRHVNGPVSLCRGPNRNNGGDGRKTAMCVGNDCIVREWDYQNGDVLSEHVTGHCDLITNLESLQGNKLYDSALETNEPITGTVTTSFDGTVRMRTLIRQ